MLRVQDHRDLLVFAFIQANDPFQWSEPAYKVAWQYPSLLPPEVVQIKTEDITRMAIKTIAVADAPQKVKGGGFTSNQDYADVMEALRNPQTNPATKATALIVDMTDKAWMATHDNSATDKTQVPDYPKPELAFAYALRRYFAANALPLIAYSSGKLQVTVRRITQAEVKAQETKKKKK